jgi:riboflavin biosynthesis pyrimidine reductase
MVASVDGRVTIGGRSAPLSGSADRDLFHALRANADAVMAGASTMAIEGYGPIIRDGEMRSWRRERGLPEQPAAVIAAGSSVDPGLPLLADPGSHVIVMGSFDGTLDGAGARIDYIRSGSLADGLRELRGRFGVGLVVCEGGPRLAGALAREHVLDELFLAISPQLVGGDPGPTILAQKGEEDPRPVSLELLLAHGDELYAHYAAG